MWVSHQSVHLRDNINIYLLVHVWGNYNLSESAKGRQAGIVLGSWVSAALVVSMLLALLYPALTGDVERQNMNWWRLFHLHANAILTTCTAVKKGTRIEANWVSVSVSVLDDQYIQDSNPYAISLQ